MSKIKQKISKGDKFGKWEVVGSEVEIHVKTYSYAHKVETKTYKKRGWLCKCDCGDTEARWVDEYSLLHSVYISCGCWRRICKETHGLYKHPLYRVWWGMKARCLNKNNPTYKHYGGRGIMICDEWKNDFQLFYDWCISHGYTKKLQIDREDNDGNYEPSNCRFITSRHNNLNKRPRKNSSGYTGVYMYARKNKNIWSSNIRVKDKDIRLGYHDHKYQAVEARNNYIINNGLYLYKIQKIKEEDVAIKKQVSSGTDHIQIYVDNSSGYVGVTNRSYQNEPKWYAKINVRGEYICLGGHVYKYQAVIARNQYITNNNLNRNLYKIQTLLPEDQEIKATVERLTEKQ